jgi:FkbM family methyltransferase
VFPILPTSPTELRDLVLSSSIQCLKFNTFLDNFDTERFNFDGVDRSKIFNSGDRVYWISWLFENYKELFWAFSHLASERSRDLFLNLIAYRIAGHHSVRIETCFDEKSPSFELYNSIEEHTPSKLPPIGEFGKLRHYDFIYNEKRYVADCLGFKYYLFRGQYFLNEGALTIAPSYGDFVIDAGACLGDTTIVFGKAVGRDGKVFAFDPVQDHLDILTHNITQNPDCNIQTMPFGLSDIDQDYPPIKLNKYSPGFSTRGQNVPLRCLDTLVIEGRIKKVDFVKMDIEGAELSALKGAAGTIRKFHPKLAISLYHKPTDIFEIPIFIAKEFPFYKMFVEHYTIHNEETVLYCI